MDVRGCGRMEESPDLRAEEDLRADILGGIAALIATVWDAIDDTRPVKWSDCVARDPRPLIGNWTADSVTADL
jgi:hypothetical protein